MKQDKNIHNTNKLLRELDELHHSMEIPYKNAPDEIWKSFQQKLTQKKEPTHYIHPFQKHLWLVAAAVILLMGLGTLLRFYHHTFRTASGQMATLTLPDGSTAILNVQSQLTYYPLWWNFSAKVNLTGEAFFKGHHTKRFSVHSSRGIVKVLGTSFDIYARADSYRVVCFTGRIRVISRTKKQMILTPGDKAEIGTRGEITFSREIKTDNYNAWTNHQFVFTAAPFISVLNELARRYNVEIKLKKNVHAVYTGNFSAELPVSQALNIVCKPFGLTFVETDRSHFIIQ